MHFLLPLLFYIIFSTASGCPESSNFEIDTLLETEHLGNTKQCDNGANIVLDRLLEQQLGQFMQNGELNMETLMVKVTEILKNSNLQSVIEEFPSSSGCTSNTFESEVGDEDKVIQMSSSDTAGTCGTLN